MRYVLPALLLAIVPAASAGAQDRFAETCHGTETVRVGSATPETMPYTITFSADLRRHVYCYAECRPDQTFPIADPGSDPVKLAATGGDQPRLLTFERRNATVADHQIIRLLGTVERTASAACRPSPFHPPAAIAGNQRVARP